MTSRDRLIKKNKLEGMEIDRRISENHKYNDEFALLRKEIRHIEEVLNITPTEEFAKYNAEAESIKAEVKAHLAEARQSVVQ